MQTIQYCAKVMQTNFVEILAFRGFLKEFRLKQYFDETSLHFRDTYCFDPCKFSKIVLLTVPGAILEWLPLKHNSEVKVDPAADSNS